MGTSSRRLLVALFLLAFVSVNCNLARPVIERIRPSNVLASLRGEDVTPTRDRQPTPRPTFTSTPNYKIGRAHV